MDTRNWTQTSTDPGRAKRLAVGYCVGAAVVVAVAVFATLTATGVVKVPQEIIRNVTLARSVPAPEPAPVAKPAPAKANKPRRVARAGAGLSVPTAIPDSAPEEADVGTNPFGDEANQDLWGSAKSEPKAVVVAPKPKPVKRLAPPRPPTRVVEHVVPPRCRFQRPDYPTQAKRLGIEGTVVVKYTVLATGDVKNARVLKGPAELQEAGLEAVQNAICQPAMLDGEPVAVFRIARFPFRLRA
ncbi:MAG: TonB family protein [Polyangiaceae bacterium]|nr:TonB family protein [Polyangiaceae bacterium]